LPIFYAFARARRQQQGTFSWAAQRMTAAIPYFRIAS